MLWIIWAYVRLLDTMTLRLFYQKNDVEAILQRFSHDLEFGTGGIRALTGVGTNRLNPYTIRKITYAYAKHLKDKHQKYNVKQ